MKSIGRVLWLAILAALVGCATTTSTRTSTRWGDGYLPESPWRDYSSYVPLGELLVVTQTSGGPIGTARIDTLVYPQANAYSLLMKPVLFEWQIYLFERDFPALRAIFAKFDEWRRQATEMDVSLDKEIGRLRVPVSLKWGGRQDWIAALPEAMFSFHTTDSDVIRYVLMLEFPKIEFFEDQPGHNPPLTGLRLVFHPDTVTELDEMLDDSGIAASLSIVDGYLRDRAATEATARAAEEEQRKIYEAFD